MPDEHKPSKPFKYPGSVAHFRAWMEGFLTRHQDHLPIEKTNHIYTIEYTPIAQNETREAWHIFLEVGHGMGKDTSKEERDAMILALEELPNITTVRFIDGAYYKPSSLSVGQLLYRTKKDNPPPYQPKPEKVFNYPIGDDLALIAEQIKAALEANTKVKQDSISNEPQSKRGRRSPNLDTAEKIKKLLKIRNDAITKKKDIPKWSSACDLAGIDHKTALNYLKELRPHWEDSGFQWSGILGNLGNLGNFRNLLRILFEIV